MAIDPSASAADAIAAYLAGAITVTFDGAAAPLDCRRGWNEENKDYDLSAGPICSVTPISDQTVYHAPFTIDEAATVSWKVGDMTIMLQVDLWSPYRAVRDTVAQLIEAAWHNDLPYRGGLYLTHSDYFGRPLVATASGGRALDSDSLTPSAAEWRTTWDLRVESAKIVQAATPQQLTWTLRQYADDVVLPDETITP